MCQILDWVFSSVILYTYVSTLKKNTENTQENFKLSQSDFTSKWKKRARLIKFNCINLANNLTSSYLNQSPLIEKLKKE